jgi:hypothetical protein
MPDSTPSPNPAALTGLRRGALIGYQWMLATFLLMGVVQIFLAGLGVFSLNGRKLGAPGETAFDPHRNLGFAMGGVAFLILVLALLARPGARAIILAAVLFLLAFLLQSVLAGLGDNTAFFGGLHAVDGLLILAIASFLYTSSRRWRS